METLEDVQNCELAKVKRNSFQLTFLGFSVCRRAFKTLTGISSSSLVRAARLWALGSTEMPKHTRKAETPVHDQMVAALWALIQSIHDRSPLKNVNFESIIMPFHHKMLLYRMLVDWYKETVADTTRPVLMTQYPKYSTMTAALKDSQFKHVKFHRVVDMGRCPTCSLLQYKCHTAVGPEARSAWQALAAKHQWLQRAQKQEYAKDRMMAAADFPATELYMAMDGGSGFEFVLPHLSAASQEGPSKALKMATVPLKVMNGLVHGDHRSHVILSPGVIVAGACHSCETIAIMINACMEDHGDVPKKMSLQMDNAATNHNMLVIAFAGLYVMEGVADSFRLRFGLEHHNHDIYDAFQAIHAQKVYRSTFYTWNEIVSVISEAHQKPSEAQKARRPCTMMGHDVLVSNLWHVRDFWEWLAPGRKEDADEALSRAAFVAYDRLSDYHDFLVQLEPGSTGANRRVGLWAKRYMSDPAAAYLYLGTLTSFEMFRTMVGDRVPEFLAESKREAKTSTEQEALKHFLALSKGPFREQFTPERLADAIAICQRDWAYFRNSSGTMPADGRRTMLPGQLFQQLRFAGKRGGPAATVTPPPPDADSSAMRSLQATCVIRGRVRRTARQLSHSMRDSFRVVRGPRVDVVARYGRQPQSEAEFLARQPGIGGFVATLPAASSAFAQQDSNLVKAAFWTWRVLKAYQPGETFPEPVSGRQVAVEETYEAQLFAPGKDRKMRALWDKMSEAVFLRTKLEKQRHRLQLQRRGAKVKKDKPHRVLAPLTAYLRKCNMLGGGFVLTSGGRVPPLVQQVLLKQAAT